MSKLDTYNINTKEHEKMLLEMNQSLKITKGNHSNNLYVKQSDVRDSLSDRFLTVLADIINNNLQFLLFQAAKRSESLLEINKKEATEEAANFINSDEIKQFIAKHNK